MKALTLLSGEIKSKGIPFIADGIEPQDKGEIGIEAYGPASSELQKMEGWVFITVVPADSIKLKLEAPKNAEIKYITPTPSMPTVKCKAKLSGSDLSGNYVANWTCKVEYHFPPSRCDDERNYTDEKFFDSNHISEWDLNFNNSVPIIGGEAKIKVSTVIKGKMYSDSVTIYIRGENPPDASVLNGLDNGQIAMLRTESSNLDQFDTENYAEPNVGLPLRGGDGHGWGLCQIDDRSHQITTALLWDWTANRAYGVNYYNQQRNGARARLEATGHLDTPAPGQTRQSMIDSEAYARYNDGPSARYWEWVTPTETIPGHWIVRPTAVRNGERVDLDDLGEHVRNYLDNY